MMPAMSPSGSSRVGAALAGALALTAGAACNQPRSKLCTDVCAKEAECVEKLDDGKEGEGVFDEGDCVAACAALQRDQQTLPRVQAHATCVQAAGGDCTKILACP